MRWDEEESNSYLELMSNMKQIVLKLYSDKKTFLKIITVTPTSTFTYSY